MINILYMYLEIIVVKGNSTPNPAATLFLTSADLASPTNDSSIADTLSSNVS